MRENVLVIAAHPDDEAFGCLGTLLKHRGAGDRIFVQWFTPGRDDAQTLGAFNLAKKLGFQAANELWADQELEQHKLREVIGVAEKAVQLARPQIVYTNFIGDLNRDHRIVSEAAMVACRPYKKDAPKAVWMFAVPGTTELGLRTFVNDRKTRIDVAEKHRLLKTYYGPEMVNGREGVPAWERFERWPRP